MSGDNLVSYSGGSHKLALVEVFRSPQGEGYHAGRDAIFVRFSGCPLSCVFANGAICDTPYQQANIKTTVRQLFEEQIADLLGFPFWELASVPREQRVMLILTGGEPTAAPAFDAVVQWGVHLGFYVAVETNGTKWRYGLQAAHWLTVSPKEDVTQGSPAEYHNHNPQSPSLDPEVVHHLEINAMLASGEYRYVIGGRHTPDPPTRTVYRSYLSPATLSDGVSKDATHPGFAEGAVARCLEIQRNAPHYGWRISTQQHKTMGQR